MRNTSIDADMKDYAGSSYEQKTYTNEDVEMLYNAFKELCEHISGVAGGNCSNCPRNNTCYGKNGPDFTAALYRIRKSFK